MRTERRWGMRKSVEVDVVIDNQPLCLLHGSIGNVSIGGLFVRTKPAALNPNARVELVLLLQEGGGTRVYRMPAIVVRLTDKGAGLIFDRYDIDAFRTLVSLLRDNRWRKARREKNAPNMKSPVTKRFISDDHRLVGSGLAGAAGGANGAAAPVASISYNHSPGNGEPLTK